MSEHEQEQNIGRLVEEMNHTKDKLNHVNEKLRQAQQDWSYLVQGGAYAYLQVRDGKIVAVGNPQGQRVQERSLEALLNHHELVEVLEEKQRWTAKYNEAAQHFRTLAPHLHLQPA